MVFCVFSEVSSEIGLIECLTSIPYSYKLSDRIANNSPLFQWFSMDEAIEELAVDGEKLIESSFRRS